MPELRDIEGLFDGEELFVVGDYKPRKTIGSLDLKSQFVLGIDRAFYLYPALTFWCSDNFAIDWPKYSTDIQRQVDLRIFTPRQSDRGDNFVHFTPYPLWAMPDEEVTRWRDGYKGNDCPIAIGGICLAVGLAFRLGFRRVVEVGTFPDGEHLRYDPETSNYTQKDWVDPKDVERTKYPLHRMIDLLGIEISFHSKSLV